MDGLSLSIGGTLGGAICYAIVKIFTSRNQRTEIKRPLDSDDTFVTHKECKEYRCAIERRVAEIQPALKEVLDQLRENDKKSEERAINSNRRIDAVLERVAQNMGEVKVLRELVLKGEK